MIPSSIGEEAEGAAQPWGLYWYTHVLWLTWGTCESNTRSKVTVFHQHRWASIPCATAKECFEITAIAWTFLAKQAGKSHPSSKWLYSGSLPPQRLCLLDSLLQAGFSLWHEFPEWQRNQLTCFWDSQRKREKKQPQALITTSHLSHFSPDMKCHRKPINSSRGRNRAQGDSVASRESTQPFTWYQILLQLAGRSWKPAHHDKPSPENSSCSAQHFLIVYCSTPSNLEEFWMVVSIEASGAQL